MQHLGVLHTLQQEQNSDIRISLHHVFFAGNTLAAVKMTKKTATKMYLPPPGCISRLQEYSESRQHPGLAHDGISVMSSFACNDKYLKSTAMEGGWKATEQI